MAGAPKAGQELVRGGVSLSFNMNLQGESLSGQVMGAPFSWRNSLCEDVAVFSMKVWRVRNHVCLAKSPRYSTVARSSSVSFMLAKCISPGT